MKDFTIVYDIGVSKDHKYGIKARDLQHAKDRANHFVFGQITDVYDESLIK